MKYIGAVLVAVIVLAVVVSIAVADHYEYRYQHYNKSALAGYENTIVYNWAIADTAVVWTADGTIKNDVIEAIGNWEQSFSKLGWATSTRASDVNVKFIHQNCGDVAGWFRPTAWQRVGDANYLNKAVICVNSYMQFWNLAGHNGRVAVIAHEMGHVYSLADRYRHNPLRCNNTLNSEQGEIEQGEKTIMDGMVRTSTTTGNSRHCDIIEGPATSTDVVRVRDLYSKGSLEELTVTTTSLEELSNGESTGTKVSWEDAAWAEKEHRVRFYIDERGRKRQFHMIRVEEGIGTHRDILGVPANASPKPYELSYTFSPQKFSAQQGNEKLPDKASYQFCGTPYFKPFNKEGTTNCSGSIELVNPRGELSATSSSVSVNDTVTISLTSLYPNNFSDFSVKVSGPISSSDECKQADEFLNASSSISVSGCSDGEGKVTLLSKPHAVTLAELTITVESSSQTPAVTPTSLLVQYDANMNGRIDREEVINAITDFLHDGTLTREQVIQVIQLYLFG